MQQTAHGIESIGIWPLSLSLCLFSLYICMLSTFSGRVNGAALLSWGVSWWMKKEWLFMMVSVLLNSLAVLGHRQLLRYSTYKIYKVLQYAIAQECQQNVNRQWSYASLKNLTWLDDKCSFGWPHRFPFGVAATWNNFGKDWQLDGITECAYVCMHMWILHFVPPPEMTLV